jgi:D-2-hydroxyacid dehydrogenase (NADP+)
MINPPLIDTTESKANKKILLVVPETLPKLYDDKLKGFSDYNIVKVNDNRESILSEINGANALIGCPRHIFDDEIIETAGDTLRWVHNPGAGVEHLLTDRLINSDIVFTNGKIIQGPECADHALGLLLSLTRNITRTLKTDHGSHFPRPIELLGKKAVIIGVGGIGMCIAERLNAFGVNVTGVDDDFVPMLSSLKNIETMDRLPEVVCDADIICMSAPHTFKTDKIINKELVKRFKKGSYFINVSRGATVDTEALIFALEDNILAGVGIDVTDPEPLPKDHKLNMYENVVITSHIAGLSEFNRDRSVSLIGKNIARFVRGENLINVVNKVSGY